MSRVKKIPDRDIILLESEDSEEFEDSVRRYKAIPRNLSLGPRIPSAVRPANEDFPNFEQILEKKVEEHKKQGNEEVREKLSDIERKEFRKSNFEKVIQDCID